MGRGVSILAHKALWAVPHTPQSVEVQLHHLRSHSAKALGLRLACLQTLQRSGPSQVCGGGCGRGALNHYCNLNSHGSLWNRWELVLHLVSCTSCSLQHSLHTSTLGLQEKGWSSGLLPHCSSDFHLQSCN